MPHTILNVDDNEAGLYATSRILKQAGFVVKEAATGNEALRIAAEIPDAIVLDVNLPDISGFEVCRRIKGDPATARIPILHLSAKHMDPASKVTGLDGGAQAYLTQPVEPSVLIAYLKTLFRTREAEEALAAEKRRLEVTLRSVGDGVITTDVQGRVIGLNRQAEELTGWSEKEAAGRLVEEVFHIVNEKTRERCENPVEKVLRSRKIVGLSNETVLIARDGTERILADSGAPIQDDTGNVLGVVLTFRDVTQEKRRAEALEENERRLSTLMANLPGIAYRCLNDRNWTMEFISEGCKDLTGYSPDDLLQNSALAFADLIHPDDRKDVWDQVQDVIAENRPFQLEYRIRTRSGDERWVWEKGRKVSDVGGDGIKLEGLITDVTDRKKAEDALHESERVLAVRDRVAQAFLTKTDEQVYADVLKTILEATDSPYGIFGYLNEDGAMVCPSMTRTVWKDCQVPDKTIVFPPETWSGIWGKAFIEKRTLYSNEPFDVPEGHVPIFNHLVAPIVYGGELTGTLQVSNKEGGYDERDIQLMGAIADYVAPILHARLQWEREERIREEAEEALLQSKLDWERTFDAVPDLIALIDREHRLVRVNKTMAERLGISPQEAVGLKCHEAVHGLATPPDFCPHAKAIRYGKEHSVEMEEERLGGTFFITSSPLFDVHGNFTRCVHVARDITDRKRAEELIAQSEERYRTLFEQALDAILIVESGGEIVSANPSCLELFGAPKEEVIGAAADGFYWNPADRVTFRQKMDRDGYVRNFEFKIRRKDGNKRYCLMNSSSWNDPADKFSGYLSIVRDVTERRQAEKDSLRLGAAIEQAAETVLITDQEGTIVYANPACERTTGYSLNEIIGRNPRIFKSGKQSEEFYKELWKTITKGETWTGILTNKKKDGTVYQEEASISPVRDENGSIVAHVAVKRDVTRELSLERQVREAQKMEAIGTLAGGISHDFNNLLQVISGYSELLLMNTDREAPGHEDLTAIHQAAVRGNELVKQILAFSRKLETELCILNLNDQVLHVERMLYRTIPKMISIELRLDRDLWNIDGDPGQMEQVLMNLAVNAKDAMPDGGKLLFETHNVVLDREYARTHLDVKPGEYVLVGVSDTGTGMERAVSERIYEPFFSTKGAGEGTGLGLAMVYGIVKNHDGHVQCYSEPGHGTTFKIYLPATERKEQDDREISEELPVGGTETILIVDDEPMIGQLAERILEKAGYSVITASNGIEALEIYERERSNISLVILDLIMPEMGGQQCLEELLKINPEIKALIASGFAVKGGQKAFIKAEAKGMVSKPFNMRELLRSVRHVLDIV